MASAAAERIRAELFGPQAILNNPISLLDSISELRARELRARERDQQPVGGVSITPWSAGGVAAEWILPSRVNSNEPIILYIHGGGFVGGCCATYRNLVSRLAIMSDCRVLVPEYRLAPEHCFPAPVEDAFAVYKALIRDGANPGKLVIAGDSAGGGICAALLMAVRDSGGPLPAGAALISPWTDLTFSGDSYRTRANVDPMDRLPWLRRMAELYLGGSDPTLPWASPVLGDLGGLPQIHIQVGDHEVLLDDSRRLFEKARQQGVQAQIEVWPEMWHGWHMSVPDLPEAIEAIRRVSEFVVEVTSA